MEITRRVTVAGVLVARHGATHVAHRCLDAAGDEGGGVEQGAVPVEGDVVELAWSHGGSLASPSKLRTGERRHPSRWPYAWPAFHPEFVGFFYSPKIRVLENVRRFTRNLSVFFTVQKSEF
jgi:hypothetical protein